MKKLKLILILLFVLFTSTRAIGQSLTYTFIDPCTKDVTYFSIPIQSGGGTTIFFLGQQRYFTANDVTSGDFASWINQTYADYRKISPCGVQQARVTQNQITSQIIGSTIQSVVGSIMSQAKSESNTSSSDGSLVSENSNNSKDNKKSKNGKNNANNGSNTTTNNSSGNGSNNSNVGSQTISNGSTTSNTTTNSSTNTTTNSSTNTTTNSSTNTTNSGSSSGGNGTNNSGSSQNGNGSGSSSSQNGNGSGSSSSQTNGQGNSQAGGQSGGSSNSSTTKTGSQVGGQAGGQAGGQGSGNNTTKTEGGEVVGTTTMTVDANNDRGIGGSGKGGGKGGRTNPVIISSDLTNAQNLDRSYTGIINVGMSQSSMTGTSSWGVNSMIWFNFKQFALTGRYTKIHYSKTHKLKLIHNVNLTGVYSYGNILGFLGYSAILNAGKFGITGINVSGAVTKTPDDVNLFMSPSATAFYTKPFKVGKRLILSPELYVISTPLIYSSVDKVSVSDRTFSAFIGTGVDYQISKRFKVNMNYKLNMSTNPEFPVLSFFLIGSKINL